MAEDTSPEDVYPPDADDVEPDSEDTSPVPRAAQIRAHILSQRTGVTVPAKVNKKAVNRLQARQRQRQALELRKAGSSFAQIAEALGYADASGAHKAVTKAFKEVIHEPTIQLKRLQVERLNHMLLTLWAKVQAGDERAIDTALRVMDKLDRLEGTEAATNVDVNHKGAILVVDGSKEDFIRAAKQMTGISGTGENLPAIDATIDAEIVVDDPDAVTQDLDVVPDTPSRSAEDAETVDVSDVAVTDTKAPSTPRFNFGMDPERFDGDKI